MGGGQSSTQNSTQVANKTPWDPAIPGLQQSLSEANRLYSSGIGQGVYSGQRVADFSGDQSAGIQGIRGAAGSDNAGNFGTSYLQGVLGSGGISPTTARGLDMLSAVPNVDTSRLSALADRIGSADNPINQTANAFMSGSRDLTTIPQLQGLFAKSQAPSSAETNLSGVAAGQYLDPTTNPFLQAAVQTSNQNAANAVKEAYAKSGRYGSGNFQGATTKAINDTDTQLYASQYNQERANQLSATGQIDAARQAASGLGTTITNAISGVQSTNNSQRLAGAGLGQAQQAAQAGVLGQVLGGDEFNSNLGVTKANGFIGAGQTGQSQAIQAAGLLPSLDALRYAPGGNLLQIGGLQQQQAQQGLDAAQQYFQEQQQTPWQALSQYSQFPLAIGSQGGTTVSNSTQRTQQSGPSGLQTALGIGSGLLSLGTGGGSTLGGTALMGLFGGSDERLKEDIRPVGELHDGQPIYSYRYRGDPRVQIGLLAHEVAKREPEAVAPLGLGDMLGVDYGKATDEAARIAAKDGKGSKGSTGGSSPPPAPPASALHALLDAMGRPSAGEGRSLGGDPRMTLVIQGEQGRDTPAAGLGHSLAEMMGMGGPGGSGLGAHAMRLIPQEPAPARRERPKPPANGKRRAAA